MVNSMLILGPLGMILVGSIAIAYWTRSRSVSLKYSFIGGILWAVAIAPKVVMDLTVTPLLNNFALSTYGVMGAIVLVGIYVGVRTGLFENGFTYLAVLRSGLKQVSYNEVLAVGIGFGSFEAIILGLPAVMSIISFILYPDLIDLLPEVQRKVLEQSSLIIFAPIIERVFTLFAHIFTTLFVFLSIVRKKITFFIIAFVYKTTLDSIIPYLNYVFHPNISLTGTYLAEIPIVALGIIALIGIYWVNRSRVYAPIEHIFEVSNLKKSD